MGQKMKWDEIKRQFPDEWVAVVNYTTDDAGEIEGEIAVHSTDKSAFYRSAKNVVSQYGGMAMRYTGTLISNAETPLLWQISDTASTNV